MHEPVHDEGRPGHVARVLHEGNATHEDHDHGHEDDDGAHTRNDPVHQQAGELTRGEASPRKGSQRLEALGDPVLGDLPEDEGQRVGQDQHGDEDGDAEDPVGEDRIQAGSGRGLVVGGRGHLLHQAVGEAVAALRHQRGAVRAQVRLEEGEGSSQLVADRLAGVALGDLALGLGVVLQELQGQPAGRHGRLQLLVPADLCLKHPQLALNVMTVVHGDPSAAVGLAAGHGGQQGLQLRDALLPVAHGGDDRPAEEDLQGRHVDVDAPVLGVVHHVQHEGHGLAELQQLGAEVEVALQVGGVEHVQHQVHFGGGQILGGHPFVLAARRQRIGARQVHHLQRAALVLESATAPLHRDPGPVAHMVPGARQGVEQRGLPAVGIARQGDGKSHQITRCTRMQELSSRRRDRW